MDGILSATEAVGVGKQTPRTYVPRIVHIPSEQIHVLIGVASHQAWVTLARKYKMIRLKGKRDEHNKLTGSYMKAWCWELVAGKIGA